jgi:ubiquinone/menaquinone biosynthesis C-methylase UbiE
MSFYGEQVLPRVTNRIMDNKNMRAIRKRVCEGLAGDVVEIGFGSGLNVPYYPDAVTGVWAVEPAALSGRLAAKRIEARGITIERAGLDGQRLDLPDERFDAAIATWTLCTIPDPSAALAELIRVLKPGAAYHFAEHGHAPDDKVARNQARFEPIQVRVAGGCHLTRDMRAIISDAGFEIETLDTYYMAGPKMLSFMYVGRAHAPR